MDIDDIIKKQREERDAILKAILDSKASKKLIIAGAGTGKTYTFKKIVEHYPGGKHIAMTFIRLLRDDMYASLGEQADVRTFHEFCKKILHEQKGGIDLFPKLQLVIEGDARYLGHKYKDFSKKFQNLEEDAPELKFFLERSTYYHTVSFDDSVYRMLVELRANPGIVPKFDQILIDEFQDFNPLEVAFINELEKRGNILIVGDDDQAVYPLRSASPDHLRGKYHSGEYEIFVLPFCSRCTEVIVSSTNAIIKIIEDNDGLQGRISKRYESFVELKKEDSDKYPKIITAHCSNVQTVTNFIKKRIDTLTAEETADSWKEGSEYPTVLIVGAKQYLNAVNDRLEGEYQNYKYKKSEDPELKISDAYFLLRSNQESNLGWRILIDFLLANKEIKKVVEKTTDGTTVKSLLHNDFVEAQLEIVETLIKFREKDADIASIKAQLKALIEAEYFEEVFTNFSPIEKEEVVPDKTKPSILLTSFSGCKGLSAGFVFIIGANNGVMPKDRNNVTDHEICQFIVALTRTRKECSILSEIWFSSPKDKKGQWIPKQQRSEFIDLIPPGNLDDRGNIKSKDI